MAVLVDKNTAAAQAAFCAAQAAFCIIFVVEQH
jgi:hypothetical protein